MSYIFKNEDYFGLGFARDLLNTVGIVKSNVQDFAYPCLIISGGKDIVTNSADHSYLLKWLGSKDKQLTVLKNGFHELYVDNCKTKFLEVMDDWIKERVEKSSNLGKIKKKVKIGKKP